MTDAFLAERNVFPVEDVATPTVLVTRTLTEGVPEEVSPGQWRKTWVSVPLPLEDAKAAMWEQVKRIRETKDDIPGSTASTPFGVVQVDNKSKQNINGLVTMAMVAKGAGAPFSASFTMADNSQAALNADQMIGLGVAVGTYVKNVHDHATNLREAIDASANIETLEAIDIINGWPS